MTTKLLETLTLAEEALEYCIKSVPKHSVDVYEALAAIREQKAELEKQAEQEPVGYWQGKFSQDGGAVLYEVPQASAFGYHYPNYPVYAAPQPVKQEPVAFKLHHGEVCYKSKEDDQSYGTWCPVVPDYRAPFPEGTKFYTAPVQQSEQEPVLYPVRRGSRITCIESGEKCVVWATSHTDCWVQFPDGHAGQYTYEQIGKYFSIEENQAADEACERGLKEGIEAGKKLAEQAEQIPQKERKDFIDGYDAGMADAKRMQQAKQEPVVCKQTVRALTDQCAVLIQERDELQKQVCRYENALDFARAVIAAYKEKNK